MVLGFFVLGSPELSNLSCWVMVGVGGGEVAKGGGVIVSIRGGGGGNGRRCRPLSG